MSPNTRGSPHVVSAKTTPYTVTYSAALRLAVQTQSIDAADRDLHTHLPMRRHQAPDPHKQALPPTLPRASCAPAPLLCPRHQLLFHHFVDKPRDGAATRHGKHTGPHAPGEPP
jgi:hypothetical protein